MRYIVSAEVEADLEEIGDYIALDNPERADAFIEEIRVRFDAISHMPRVYPERPEIADGVRACVHGQYVIFYYFIETTVEIARPSSSVLASRNS